MQENDKSPIDFEKLDFNDVLKQPQENKEVFSQSTKNDIKQNYSQTNKRRIFRRVICKNKSQRTTDQPMWSKNSRRNCKQYRPSKS